MLESIEIDDRRAAAVFKVPRQRRMLLALIPEPRSLGELAKLTDTPLNLLHHHMAKFMRLGLVTVVREEPRAGAPIKYYRAAASNFFVPAELMDRSPGAGMTGQLRSLLEDSMAQSLKGFAFSHDNKGPRMRPVRDLGLSGRAAEMWLDLRLSDADQGQLVEELRAVLHRFEARSQPSNRRYIVHAAIAPV